MFSIDVRSCSDLEELCKFKRQRQSQLMTTLDGQSAIAILSLVKSTMKSLDVGVVFRSVSIRMVRDWIQVVYEQIEDITSQIQITHGAV